MKIDASLSAIVTGGASGLGLATVKALREQGVNVAIFDLNEEAGKAIAEETGAIFCQCNIMSEESVLAAFESARAQQGQERAIVHCAMVAGGGKTISWDKQNNCYKRTPTEEIHKAMEGIGTTTYRIASIAALGMANSDPIDEDGQRGAIVLTSSAASQDGQVGQVGYGSGKGAVNSMVLPMARDLMDLGIRVNAILPGIFATPPMLGVKKYSEELFEALNKSVPFPKRLGKPEEYASLALELIRNNYFNGQCVRLDGAIRMAPK